MSRILMTLAAGTLAALTGSAASLQESPAPAYPCVSRPSDMRDLGASIRGTVAEVAIKPGDRVKAGQLLVRLDDSVQRQIVEFAKLQADDQSQIKLAEGELSYRQRELELIEQARASQAGNDAQLREARYRRDQSQIALDAARTQNKLRVTELERERAQLAQMSIPSPIDATVLDIRKRAGEIVDEGNPVLTVLTVDPLWLDASVPIREAGSISLGQAAEVIFEDMDNPQPMAGKVIYKSPAGNAGARQLQIRIEVPNPTAIPSGMHGRVRLLK